MTRSRPDWKHGQKVVAVPGVAEQLPDMAILYGNTLVVRALPKNTGDIYLGRTKDLAEDINERLSYSKGNGLSLRIQNTNSIWVDAAVAGEGVDYWVEI